MRTTKTDTTIILTPDNITIWKILLSKKMKERYGVNDFAQCYKDHEWLEEYEGYEEEEAISDEIQYWDK